MDMEVYILVSPLHIGASFSAPISSDRLRLAPLTPSSLPSLQLAPSSLPSLQLTIAHSSLLPSLPAHSQWPMNSLVCIGVPTTSGGLGGKLGSSWSELGASWSKGSKLGVSWSEGSEPNVIPGFRFSTTIGGKTSIITYSAYVSPPPGSKVPTQCPLT